MHQISRSDLNLTGSIQSIIKWIYHSIFSESVKFESIEPTSMFWAKIIFDKDNEVQRAQIWVARLSWLRKTTAEKHLYCTFFKYRRSRKYLIYYLLQRWFSIFYIENIKFTNKIYKLASMRNSLNLSGSFTKNKSKLTMHTKAHMNNKKNNCQMFTSFISVFKFYKKSQNCEFFSGYFL